MSAFVSFLPRLLFLAMGCGILLRAGRLEADGRLVEAKRGARNGGFLAALGSLLAAVDGDRRTGWITFCGNFLTAVLFSILFYTASISGGIVVSPSAPMGKSTD
jgi:hypothetical protein